MCGPISHVAAPLERVVWLQVSAANDSPSKGPSQVAYGIALAAALSVEDPFMQTDNMQVSLMFMP